MKPNVHVFYEVRWQQAGRNKVCIRHDLTMAEERKKNLEYWGQNVTIVKVTETTTREEEII